MDILHNTGERKILECGCCEDPLRFFIGFSPDWLDIHKILLTPIG